MMRIKLVPLLVSLAVLLPAPVLAADSEEWPTTPDGWLDRLDEKRSGRMGGFGMYVEMMKAPATYAEMFGVAPGMEGGECTAFCRFFEVVAVEMSDGSTVNVPHLLSMLELSVRYGLTDSLMYQELGTGYAMTQDFIGENAKQGLGENAGLAEAAFGNIELKTGDVLKDVEDKSWETSERESPWLNPFRLFGASAGMMFEQAEAVDKANQTQAESAEQERIAASQKQALAEAMQVVGMTEISGRPAVHLSLNAADIAKLMPPRFDLKDWQLVAALSPLGFLTAAVTADEPDNALFWYEAEGQRYVFNEFGLWIDTEQYVLLQHRVDGVITDANGSRDFFIEGINSDFRNPPGCGDMLEPYRRVMRMGGMLDAAATAEMQKAAAELEEFDRKLAEMPADERAMVESMMGNQMDSMRSMASGGAYEHVEEIDKIVCNPDVKALLTIQTPGEAPNELVQIQRDLSTLGYEPGNTNGILDALTQVAISQYQAERGMAVTGEPSSALASTLAAEVSQQGG